jgi:hypothetical protein
MATVLRHDPSPTFRELFVGLGHDVSALLHDEIDLAKKETRRELRTGLVLLGISAVLGMAAALTLAAAAVLALGRVLEPVWAALIVGAALAVLTGGFVLFAREWRRRMDHRLLAGIRALTEEAPQ